MLWLNYIHIGYVLTIVSHAVCLHAMVYLIMRAHVGETFVTRKITWVSKYSSWPGAMSLHG